MITAKCDRQIGRDFVQKTFTISPWHVNASDDDSLFIKNVNRVGFYVSLTCFQPMKENWDITGEVDNALPRFIKLPVLMIHHFRKEMAIRTAKLFLISIVILFAVYGIQILYVAKNATYYKDNFSSIVASLASEYRDCSEGDKLSDIFHDTFSMDSVLIFKNGVAECEVHAHTTEVANSVERVDEWLGKSSRFFYVNKTYGNLQIVSRFSRNTLAVRYDRYSFFNLLSAIELKAGRETLMTTAATSGHQIYSYQVDPEFTLIFYSSSIIVYLFLTTVILSIVTNYQRLAFSYSYWRKYKYFSVKLEPVVDTRSQQTVYLEVLSRFENSDVQTAIHCLKKSGLLGFHTMLIAHALRAVKGNHRYSVNLCPSLLSGKEFNKILSQLRGADTRKIVFELTENSLVSYDKAVIENIKQLQKFGFSIAIDDFGVGNNNLSLLKVIHPDFIKIDRMFTSDVDKEIKQQKLLNKFIAIAELEATAIIFEGVERETQSHELSKLGGYLQQGYLYSVGQNSGPIKQNVVEGVALMD